jgi:hypothetical protein
MALDSSWNVILLSRDFRTSTLIFVILESQTAAVEFRL